VKLSAEGRVAFTKCIDPSVSPGTSIVLRYRDAVRFFDLPEPDCAFKRRLMENSLREGARIVSLPPYKGVAVHVLDETSGMETGSLKAIDGCLAASLCRMEGIGRIAFESGGNTGSALTRYGQNAGLETFFFCPLENSDLLDSRLFDGRRAHLVGVEERGRVKELTALFAKTAGIRKVPDRSWRYASGMFRGLFILEHMLMAGCFDWISQTISAAFGPIGIYGVLKSYRNEVRVLPRFLGVQQESNCPMFRAWNPEAAKRLDKAGREPGRLLARIMYDVSPDTHETYGDLRRLLLLTRGDLLTVNEAEFDSRLGPSGGYGPVLEWLRSAGIAISARSGHVIEKAGLTALAGTLKAVDAGVIEAGESVLCCLTGGVSGADGRARPESIVRDERDVLEYAVKLSGEGR
jgi:threonine synthase